jgi:hypothetical protein
VHAVSKRHCFKHDDFHKWLDRKKVSFATKQDRLCLVLNAHAN